MHTPDGFLTGWTCVLMLLVSLAPLALALNNLRKNITKNKALQLASLAAIIFALQMLNFPIANGTSGHFVGTALVAILFGFDAAIVVMSLVLGVQAFVFGDGGVLALGANIFNMAVVGAYAADFVYKKYKNIIAASWASVVASSLSCALLLAASGTVALLPTLFAMASVHAIIGLAEGLITLLLINYFWNRAVNSSYNIALSSTAFSFLLLALLLPFASSEPDGLERVALNLGFYENAITVFNAPITDYSISLISGSAYLSSLAAGIIGLILTTASIYGIIKQLTLH